MNWDYEVQKCLRFEVLMAIKTSVTFFCVMTSHGLVPMFRRNVSALNCDEIGNTSSEMLVSTYKTTHGVITQNTTISTENVI
jgi:hypothetical protein